jgi:hypothetical protein
VIFTGGRGGFFTGERRGEFFTGERKEFKGGMNRRELGVFRTTGHDALIFTSMLRIAEFRVFIINK